MEISFQDFEFFLFLFFISSFRASENRLDKCAFSYAIFPDDADTFSYRE